MRLVLIEWLDSFGCSTDWEPLDAPPPQPVHCKSVGWLLHDNADCKVIVPHLAEGVGQGCGDMTIPTAAVVRITDLYLVHQIPYRASM